ncbi:MAG: hypothetical protein KDG54_11220 [Geminicoccaceae bacterium]|nr:hypothetical protein [Geminicoccaceae bacterium]
MPITLTVSDELADELLVFLQGMEAEARGRVEEADAELKDSAATLAAYAAGVENATARKSSAIDRLKELKDVLKIVRKGKPGPG